VPKQTYTPGVSDHQNVSSGILVRYIPTKYNIVKRENRVLYIH